MIELLKGLHQHTREIIEWVREALDDLAPQTLRHLYYEQAPLLGFSYQALKNPLKQARLRGIVGYEEIIDTTRDPIGPAMYSGPADYVDAAVLQYRHDIWSTQDVYCEVWVEASATIPVIDDHTWDLGMQLQPCRGDMGMHTIYMAAERFKPHVEAGRTIRLLHLGDWNPKGEQIPLTIQRSLLERHGVDVEIIRVAITPEQIDAYHLPSRDVNKDDPQAVAWKKHHGKDARHVELEALPAKLLVPITREAVRAELNLEAMGRKLAAQKRVRREIGRRLRTKT